jgi:putative transposase
LAEKNLVSTLSHAERKTLVEREHPNLRLKQHAALLSLSRASLYYQPLPPSAEEIAIKHRIDELYTAHPFYGSRKITALLQSDWQINRKRMQRYMREMGLAGICPGPNLSRPAPGHQIYPYLVAILDWFSRYVISWELDHTLELPFVLTALDRALAQAKPIICNSDQGSHFTSPHYLDRLRKIEVQISMDGRGRALDNIFTERLWRSVKYEEVYLNE